MAGMRIVLVAGLLMFSGCQRHAPPSQPPPTTPVPPSVAVPAWQKRGDELAAKVRPGMTMKEVRKSLGEPTKSATVIGSGDYSVWIYELQPGFYLKVYFDRADRATGAKLDADHKIM